MNIVQSYMQINMIDKLLKQFCFSLFPGLFKIPDNIFVTVCQQKSELLSTIEVLKCVTI